MHPLDFVSVIVSPGVDGQGPTEGLGSMRTQIGVSGPAFPGGRESGLGSGKTDIDVYRKEHFYRLPAAGVV